MQRSELAKTLGRERMHFNLEIAVREYLRSAAGRDRARPRPAGSLTGPPERPGKVPDPMPAPTARRRRRAAVAIVALALVGAVVWLSVTAGNPFPPRTITMATGPPGSAFAEFGARYREVLRRSGVDVRLVPTHGGVENLERLRDPRSGVSVAFVEGGLTSPEQSPDLVSLGAISVEPLWLFFRSGIQVGAAGALAGKRLSIEPEGSATRPLALRLLALNGVKDSSLRLSGLPPARAADALMRGELDGVAMLTSLRSPVVRKLLVADGVVLLGYPRADAYVALFPSLTKVVLPTGVADLARNIPPKDVPLLAVEASLVAHRNLHPALHYLLLQAASEIHGGPEIFHRAGRFPRRPRGWTCRSASRPGSSTGRACPSPIARCRFGWLA